MMDVEAEGPMLWPPDAKSQLIGKDSDAGEERGQEEKGTTEDEMVGHVRQVGSGNLLYDAGSSNQVLCDNLEGWDGEEVGVRFKREGTHIPMADAC